MFAFLSPLAQCVAAGHLDFFFVFFSPPFLLRSRPTPLGNCGFVLHSGSGRVTPVCHPSVALSGIRLFHWEEKPVAEDIRFLFFTEAGILA